jgi:hypothetical protein
LPEPPQARMGGAPRKFALPSSHIFILSERRRGAAD